MNKIRLLDVGDEAWYVYKSVLVKCKVKDISVSKSIRRTYNVDEPLGFHLDQDELFEDFDQVQNALQEFYSLEEYRTKMGDIFSIEDRLFYERMQSLKRFSDRYKDDDLAKEIIVKMYPVKKKNIDWFPIESLLK